MNREIKFRAWDEQNKIMHFDFQFIKSGDSGNDWIIFKSDKHECFDRWVNNPYFARQMKIMQYTGLKDKNGKEIYEGDIVKSADDEVFIYKVEWFTDDIFCGWNIARSDCWYAEVIGNIHKNPELLK